MKRRKRNFHSRKARRGFIRKAHSMSRRKYKAYKLRVKNHGSLTDAHNKIIGK